MFGHDPEVAQWGIDNPLKYIEDAVKHYPTAHRMAHSKALYLAENGMIDEAKAELYEQEAALEQTCEFIAEMVKAIRKAEPLPRANLQWEINKGK